MEKKYAWALGLLIFSLVAIIVVFVVYYVKYKSYIKDTTTAFTYRCFENNGRIIVPKIKDKLFNQKYSCYLLKNMLYSVLKGEDIHLDDNT